VLPELWRRYVGLILDGLRPGSCTPLEQPAPTLEDFEASLSEKTRRAKAS